MVAGTALRVDWEADTLPAVTVTVAVCVNATPFTVAETVFAPTTLELRVPVATPLGSVTAAGCVSVLPVPVAASTTVAPLMGLPPASLAVTVIVDVPLPAEMEVGEAPSVDWDAETPPPPPVTVTVAVCVIAMPFAVAETVFDSATEELTVPVATPLAFVTLTGCVRVLPLPVEASTTVAPLTGRPLLFFTVTVMVDAVPVGTDEGAAATVDREADTGFELTVTVAVLVINVPFAVAETTFAPASVDARVPFATPLESVSAAGCVTTLPVPVADKRTAAPTSG
jgi:hypothetical protein